MGLYWGGLTDSENRNSEKQGDFWAYLFSEMKFSEKGRNCTETVLETAQNTGGSAMHTFSHILREVATLVLFVGAMLLGLTYLAIRELV